MLSGLDSEPFKAAALRESLLNQRPLCEWLKRQQQHYLNFYQLAPFSGAGYQQGCVRSGEYEVVYQCWRPCRDEEAGVIQKSSPGTFYVVHGYYDHLGIYRHLIQALLGKGYTVVGLDLPGHGLSSGLRASIITFQQYTQALWQVIQQTYPYCPGPYNLIGQSTGGAVAIDWWLNSDLQHQFNFESTVLLAPLVKPANWQQGLLSYQLLSPFLKRIKRGYSRNSHNDDFLAFLRDDPLQPRYLAVDWVKALKNWIPMIENADPLSCRMLILQGEEDRTVDWRFNTQLLRQKFPQAQLSFFPQVRHHMVNESDDIRLLWLNRLWQFLQD